MGIVSRASYILTTGLYKLRMRGLSPTVPEGKKAKGPRGDGNYVCSPFSLIMVLSLAMRGAGQETLSQLGRLLPQDHLPDLLKLTSFSNRVPSEPELYRDVLAGRATGVDVVSRIYANEHLSTNETFQAFCHDLVQECRREGDDPGQMVVELIDCFNAEASAERINGFVAQVTHNHIDEVISPMDIKPTTKLVLVSAAFFSGQWFTPFDKEETKKGIFRALDHSQYDRGHTGSDEPQASASGGDPMVVPQEVEFMHATYEWPLEGKFIVTAQYIGACLNYEDREFAMCLIRPNNPRDLDKLMRHKDDIGGDEDRSSEGRFPTLEEAMDNLIRNGRQPGKTLFRVHLPKFRLRTEDNDGELVQVLGELGIRDLFQRDVADFRKISGDKAFYVSKLLHKADIEVDENGTVATAAAAALVTHDGPSAAEVVDLRFDSSFVFTIVYHPNMEPGTPEETLGYYVLFTGYITDAEAAQN